MYKYVGSEWLCIGIGYVSVSAKKFGIGTSLNKITSENVEQHPSSHMIGDMKLVDKCALA